MDPALMFAVFKRLVGYPVDSKGMPRTDPVTRQVLNAEGKWGLRIPMPKPGQATANLNSNDADGYRFGTRGFQQNQYLQVPCYIEGIDAKRWEKIFPACSFTWSDVAPGNDPYLFDFPDGEDGIGTDTGTATITNPVTGYEYTVPDQRVTRAHPESWDVSVTFSLYSKDPFQMLALERALLILFPRKGSIPVEQLDGTFRQLDCFFERYSVMDQGEPYDPQQGIGAESSAFLKRAYTYRIETSLDNSVVGFGTNDFTTQQMILARVVELANIQSTLLETALLEALTP